MKWLSIGAGTFAALAMAGASSSTVPQPLLTYGISYGPLGSTKPIGGGLCLARADGSHAVRLSKRRDDRAPAWSPKGKYVAFFRQTNSRERRRNSNTVFEIYIADTRGRILRNLNRGFAAFNTDPSWSPDGRRLAFTGSWRGSVIVVIGRKRRRPRRLVYGGDSPEWSPDGTRLAFSARGGIYTIRLDGSDQRLLVENGGEPDFSPDGQKLVFIRSTGGRQETDVFVADGDGGNARSLTSSPESEAEPAWSPDGRLIAFTRWSMDPVSSTKWIVVVRSDTGEEVAVVRGPHSAFGPAWRPAVNLPRASRGPCR